MWLSPAVSLDQKAQEAEERQKFDTDLPLTTRHDLLGPHLRIFAPEITCLTAHHSMINFGHPNVQYDSRKGEFW